MENTHPNYLFRLKKEHGRILIYANRTEKDDNGYYLFGVTYGNCEHIPFWHSEPLFLDNTEIDMKIRILK